MTTQQKSILARVIEARYSVSDDEVQELAATHLSASSVGDKVGEMYLKVLVTRVRDRLRVTSGEKDVLAVLASVEAPMYERVKQGTLTQELVYNPLVDSSEVKSAKALEHNRRNNWARSIKSELQGAIRAGLDIESVDLDSLSKGALRKEKDTLNKANPNNPSVKPPEDAYAAANRGLATIVAALTRLDADGRQAEVIQMCASIKVALDYFTKP